MKAGKAQIACALDKKACNEMMKKYGIESIIKNQLSFDLIQLLLKLNIEVVTRSEGFYKSN